MTTKAHLIQQLEQAQATWEELALAARQTDVSRPGIAEDWTFADLAGHLNGWRMRSASRLEAAANGTEPLPPPWPENLSTTTDEGVDAINRWIYEHNHARPIAGLLAEATDQFRRMRAALEAIPEHDLLTPGHYPWLNGSPLSEVVIGVVEHLNVEHADDIRSWLRATPD